MEIERSKDRISDLEKSVEEAQIDLEMDIDEINRVPASIDEYEVSGQPPWMIFLMQMLTLSIMGLA